MTTTQTTFSECTVSVAGLSMHVIQGGDGPSAVWLHHSTGPLGWLPLHERLAERLHVSAPDLPGYGRSERPVWARHPRDIAVLLGRAIAKLELEPTLLIGHGFGGWVAAELATMNPSALRGLVLVGAAGLKPDEGEIIDHIFFTFSDYVKEGFHAAAAFEAFFGADGSKEHKELWDFSREMTSRLTWKPGCSTASWRRCCPRWTCQRCWSGERRIASCRWTAVGSTRPRCPTPGWRSCRAPATWSSWKRRVRWRR